MLSFFKNKSRQPESAAPVDPRVRLLAQIEIQERDVRMTELKFRAGLVMRAVLDRAQAELRQLQDQLAGLDNAAAASDALAAQRAEAAPAALAEYEAANADLDAALSQLEAAIAKGEAVARKIERDFSDSGRVAAPFTSTMLERLTFWNRGTAVRLPGIPWAEYGAFADRLREYRQIGQPPRPIAVAVHREPVDEQARAKRRREAMQNSRIRSRMTDHGVVVGS